MDRATNPLRFPAAGLHGAELRTPREEPHRPGCSKATAVAEWLDKPPFLGRRPVCIGDDLTDEHALQTANRHGGISIKVGPQTTGARWRLNEPRDVLAWLNGEVAAEPVE